MLKNAKPQTTTFAISSAQNRASRVNNLAKTPALPAALRVQSLLHVSEAQNAPTLRQRCRFRVLTLQGVVELRLRHANISPRLVAAFVDADARIFLSVWQFGIFSGPLADL